MNDPCIIKQKIKNLVGLKILTGDNYLILILMISLFLNFIARKIKWKIIVDCPRTLKLSIYILIESNYVLFISTSKLVHPPVFECLPAFESIIIVITISMHGEYNCISVVRYRVIKVVEPKLVLICFHVNPHFKMAATPFPHNGLKLCCVNLP